MTMVDIDPNTRATRRGVPEAGQLVDVRNRQWIVADVTLSLYNFNYNKFEFELLSDWEAAEAYEKNTSVTDF